MESLSLCHSMSECVLEEGIIWMHFVHVTLYNYVAVVSVFLFRVFFDVG